MPAIWEDDITLSEEELENYSDEEVERYRKKKMIEKRVEIADDERRWNF